MRSRILVMDEPTAGQDYQNYMNFMDLILQMPGFEAILFITHDVDLAVIYANRVLLIADGWLVADGKPQDILCDLNRLEACRLVPSSLLALNLKRLPQTGRFMPTETLAHIQFRPLPFRERDILPKFFFDEFGEGRVDNLRRSE